MKLLNKKTGGIWEIPKMRHPTVQEDDISFYALYEQAGHLFCYKSLADLNEDWEDYKPDELLIKDEKIRKAIRAWADCNLLDDDDRVFLSKPTFDCKILSLEHGILSFDVHYDDESLCNKYYTIAELCGEEEK